MTYLLLNLVFLVIAFVVFIVFRKRVSLKALLFTLSGLFLMTAVFDNLIVGLGIVDYSPEMISGIKIGFAPIEDFAYSLFAVLLIPILWVIQDKKRK